MFEFKLPDLGEGIHEGELLAWHVKEGDEIKEDEPLCEVETDKAAVTIPSPRTGKVVSLKGKPGDTIHVGDVFVVIDDGSGAGVKTETAAPGKSGSEPAAQTASGPEPQTGKGVPVPKAPAPTAPSEPGADHPVIAAPATRRLAREMGIDIRKVTGTGPGGRVTPGDLDRFGLGRGTETTASQKGGAVPEKTAGHTPAPDLKVQGIPFLEVPLAPMADTGPVEREPIRSLRRKVAVKTTTSSILIPHVAHMDEIDVTGIEAQRRAYNETNPPRGKLTLLAFVIKAAAAALRDFPMFNASIDLAANEIIYKKYYNIGFAADTPRGLMVPVIHGADRQNLAGVGYRLRHLADKAREGEIEVAELSGGTFTITNVGAIGGTHVFPIINAPECAILGLGRVEKKPKVLDEGKGDEIRIRSILPVTLCFDHRVADGAQGAAFVREIKAMLESPLEFMARI